MDSPVSRPLPADLQINLHTEVGFNHLYSSGGLSASPYAAKAEGHLRGNDRWSTRSFHETQVRSLIAAFASLTAIIFLILICRSVRSRAQWVITRKLSSDGDDSDSDPDGLIICEDPGEEEPGDSAEPAPQVLLTPPKAKKPKVEAGGEHSGAPILVESESESDDDQPSTSAGKKRKRKVRAPPSQTPSDEGSVSPSRSDEELEAANALLDLQQSVAAAGEVPLGAEESSIALPPSDAPVHGPTTSAGASQKLAPIVIQSLTGRIAVLVPFGSKLAPTDLGTPTPGAAPGVQGTGVSVTSTSLATSSDGEEPSTSSAAGESAVSPQGPVHPYYRIPRVDPEHKGVRRFRPELTTEFSMAFSNPFRQLKRMRRLLSEETLSSLELEELAQVTAETLCFAYYYERDSTAAEKPSRAAHILGRRFLVLDAAIAALQVLEEPACGEWWNRVVNVIPDDTPEDPAAYIPALSGPAARFHMDLVKRLHRALQILKTGKRLPPKETIALKRDLFCSPHSPANYRRPVWDGWREDDGRFPGTS
ncbi:hypothetical protein Emed_005086 [Eimeria media]